MMTPWMENARKELLLLPEKDREEYMASALQLLWMHIQMRKNKPLRRFKVRLDPKGNFDVIATHEE